MKKPTSPIADMHVVVDLGGERRAVSVATDLATRLQAHLTGLTLSFEPLIPVYTMSAPVPTDFIIAAREAAIAGGESAAAAFEKLADAAGIEFEVHNIESVVGEGFADAVHDCRLSDLVVIGQDNPDEPEPMRAALIEAILFDAAAPTLIVPYAGVSDMKTRRALVAWDGGAQAARAVRAALPLLALADEVLVVIVEEADKWTSGVPGADIADHLARHGLSVEVKRVGNAIGSVGATLLNIAADEAADWMVMGAYGHNRMRELLLGGATRGVLDSMTLPVFMAH